MYRKELQSRPLVLTLIPEVVPSDLSHEYGLELNLTVLDTHVILPGIYIKDIRPYFTIL